MSSGIDIHDVPRLPRGTRVVVGLSGGVDSAVAAHRLQESGYEVISVTTRNFCFDEAPFEVAAKSGSCCGLEAMEAAAEVAAGLGISHRVLDVADVFGPAVVDDYREEYHAGRTPSPCVRCNSQVRFPELLRFAEKLGASHVATGHYVRQGQILGERYLRRGVDRTKDQSYFLYRLPSSLLERVIFPLGELCKDEVRGIAREQGLPVAEASESQELCFVPDGDRRPLLGPAAVAGEIVDEEGRVLGEHDGIEFFTPGQRRGLGVGGGEPYFVLRLEPDTRRVVVGREDALCRNELWCRSALVRDLRWLDQELVACTRYRHPGVSCRAADYDEKSQELHLRLKEEDRAPAPGQTVVIYVGDVAVGGGTLERAGRNGELRSGELSA
jgi:tRNA-uridine 2-sulfurtransferase